MVVRVLATIILTGGAAGGLLLAAPLIGAGLATGVTGALCIFAALAGLALIVRERERGRTDRIRLQLEASARRDVLLAQLAVAQLAARQGAGRDIEATYYRVGR